MIFRFIKLTFATSLFFFVNQSFDPVFSIDCDAHFSRPTNRKTKEMTKQKKSMKKSDKLNEKYSK